MVLAIFCAATARCSPSSRRSVVSGSGFAAAVTADEIVRIAFMWFVYAHTESAAAVGWLMVCFTAPIVVDGLLAGWVLDRFDRRLAMMVDNLVRMAAIVVVPLLHASRPSGALASLRRRQPVRPPADDDPARRHAHAHSRARAARTTSDRQRAGGCWALRSAASPVRCSAAPLIATLERAACRAAECRHLSVLRLDACGDCRRSRR